MVALAVFLKSFCLLLILTFVSRPQAATIMSPTLSPMDREGLSLALRKAKQSYAEGGVPIGSSLLESNDSTDGDGFRILGAGHNERWQKASATLHAEISTLETAGRQAAEVYRKCTIVSKVHLG